MEQSQAQENGLSANQSGLRWATVRTKKAPNHGPQRPVTRVTSGRVLWYAISPELLQKVFKDNKFRCSKRSEPPRFTVTYP